MCVTIDELKQQMHFTEYKDMYGKFQMILSKRLNNLSTDPKNNLDEIVITLFAIRGLLAMQEKEMHK
jgi:hypothetical protein